jgi:Mrp family chromosome partitioning ATPase
VTDELEFEPASVPTPEAPLFAVKARVTARPGAQVVRAVLGADPAIVEQFRVLKAKVAVMGETRPFRCIGVVSALGGEGKTTVALGLAVALAQEPGRRVLFVECDLRHASAERYLGLPAVPGLSVWLRTRSGEVCLRRVVPAGFELLSAGLATNVRLDLDSVDHVANLLRSAGQEFDWVVVDCPPLAPVADSLLLQDTLDGFLLVVRARRTPREAVTKALSLLKPGRVQGLIFNDHREFFARYYGGYEVPGSQA